MYGRGDRPPARASGASAARSGEAKENEMSQQEDDLERRVLAHELDVLIAQMSETEPKLLARFRNLFTHGRHPKKK